jgi:DNA-binding phage protein
LTNITILEKEDIKNLVESAGSVFNLSTKTGVREVSLYRYLNGTAKPTIATLQKLNQYKSEEVENELINS